MGHWQECFIYHIKTKGCCHHVRACAPHTGELLMELHCGRTDNTGAIRYSIAHATRARYLTSATADYKSLPQQSWPTLMKIPLRI